MVRQSSLKWQIQKILRKFALPRPQYQILLRFVLLKSIFQWQKYKWLSISKRFLVRPFKTARNLTHSSHTHLVAA